MVSSIVPIVASLAAACGAASPEKDTTPPPAEGGCLNCDSEPPENDELDVSSSSVLWIVPDSLMFYADLGSEGFEPQQVTVINKTLYVVLITGVYITDKNGKTTGTGDDAFFKVDVPDDKPILGPSEHVSFDVRFLGSTEQRTAWLVVETTHAGNPVLSVSLSGKYFLSDGTF